MEQLSLVEKNGANYILYEISGALNTYTITEFQEKVDENIRRSNLVVDMERIESVDSVGVGVIMAAFNDGEEHGHKFYIMNPSPATRQALEETGFYNVFYFIHSVTEVQ